MRSPKSKSRKAQLDFFNNKSMYASLKQLGGSQMTSHPKRKRPVSTKEELHIVMSSEMARGAHSMRKGNRPSQIKKLVFEMAKSLGVSISRFENVGNHLHLLVKVKTHEGYVQFIRGTSAAISRLITGARRGQPKTIKFWDGRPFTRIVTWGRDRLGLLKYLNHNRIEAIGFSVFVKENELGYLLTG